MVARQEEDKITFDMKGPPKKQLRLAIKVKDIVRIDDTLKRGQRVNMEDKGLKNASQEDTDKLVFR